MNVLKELELARSMLNKKNQEFSTQVTLEQMPLSEVVTSVENDENSETQSICSDWVDTESIISTEFEVVTPKRNRKPPRRLSLSLIPKQKKRKGTSKTKTCHSFQNSSTNRESLVLQALILN